MKKKKMEKKRRRTVRDRQWEDAAKHDTAFSHDLAKHRRASVKLRQVPDEQNPLPSGFTPNATVIFHSKKWALVDLNQREQLCLVDERLKENDATLLAPGDRVLVEFEEDEAFIRGIAPRQTKLCRPGLADARLKEQVFAANVDLLVMVTAVARPPFRPGLIDRYLIAAEVGRVEPILCVNKIDLVDQEPESLQLYRDLGVRVFVTSCETGQGLDELREALKGKLSVLSGHSGVGKSTLLNRLAPHLDLFTQEVSDATTKGRHSTTIARMYRLPNEVRIIDTPGIRALGVWNVTPAEIAYYFPEIAEVSQGCRFRNCVHLHEPDCAVRDAVESGGIPAARYASYRRLRASMESDLGNTPGRIKPTE